MGSSQSSEQRARRQAPAPPVPPTYSTQGPAYPPPPVYATTPGQVRKPASASTVEAGPSHARVRPLAVSSSTASCALQLWTTT